MQVEAEAGLVEAKQGHPRALGLPCGGATMDERDSAPSTAGRLCGDTERRRGGLRRCGRRQGADRRRRRYARPRRGGGLPSARDAPWGLRGASARRERDTGEHEQRQEAGQAEARRLEILLSGVLPTSGVKPAASGGRRGRSVRSPTRRPTRTDRRIGPRRGMGSLEGPAPPAILREPERHVSRKAGDRPQDADRSW